MGRRFSLFCFPCDGINTSFVFYGMNGLAPFEKSLRTRFHAKKNWLSGYRANWKHRDDVFDDANQLLQLRILCCFCRVCRRSCNFIWLSLLWWLVGLVISLFRIFYLRANECFTFCVTVPFISDNLETNGRLNCFRNFYIFHGDDNKTDW